jgi:hypothetical protein
MRRRLRHLPSGLIASAVLLVVGAAAGVLLVAASYTVSSLVIAWADAVRPALIMPVGLLTYAVKFTLIGILMWVVAGTGWAGLPAMGVGVIAGALGWTTAQAVWTWRARIPYVEIDGQP